MSVAPPLAAISALKVAFMCPQTSLRLLQACCSASCGVIRPAEIQSGQFDYQQLILYRRMSNSTKFRQSVTTPHCRLCVAVLDRTTGTDNIHMMQTTACNLAFPLNGRQDGNVQLQDVLHLSFVFLYS